MEQIDSIPADVDEGGSLCWDGGDIIYAFPGFGTNSFYAYSISAQRWTQLPDIPPGPDNTPVAAGGALTFTTLGGGRRRGTLYAFKGGLTREFWCYRCWQGDWQRLPDIPGEVRIGAGGALTIHAFPDPLPHYYKCHVYALKGDNSKEFYLWEQTFHSNN